MHNQDLSEDEEASLPLPPDWMRSMDSDRQQTVYKNTTIGLESHEHPYIHEAMNSARKFPLPEGWGAKEVVLSDGSKDVFYNSAKLGVSMWDPPLLRECLSKLMAESGYEKEAIALWDGGAQFISDNKELYAKRKENAIVSAYDEYSKWKEIGGKDKQYNWSSIDDVAKLDHEYTAGVGVKGESPKVSASPSLTARPRSPSPQKPIKNNVVFEEDLLEEIGEDDKSSVTSIADQNLQYHTKNWIDYRKATLPVIPERDPRAHLLDKSKPPKSAAGIRILSSDVREANERVHELIVKLRVSLCSEDGLDCRVINPSEVARGREDNEDSDEDEDEEEKEERWREYQETAPRAQELLLMAADILVELRRQPEYIIGALAMCNPTTNGMAQICFTALHRVLHPFSTDQSLTTLFLLQGINYQVEEVMNIAPMFPELDKRKLASRAMFISDPNTALNWNPLAQPMPVVPCVPSETVLTCMLRTYALRRDVTSFFRATWKPILKSIISVVETNEVDGSRTFSNLVQTASRLIEATFNDAVMASFPPIATAVCRSLFEIGGNDALHSYIFNLLILPNILKILQGDHESVDNEKLIRLESMGAFSHQYFNIDSWWAIEGLDRVPFDSLNTFIWVVWKVYTASALINQAEIEITKSDEFFAGHPKELDLAAVSDKKLRIVLLRCQRRIDYCSQCLLRMPLDPEGSKFLGISVDTSLQDLETFTQTIDKKAIEARRAAILPKESTLVSLTVLGRHELANLMSDVGISIESRERADVEAAGVDVTLHPETLSAEALGPLFSSISDYLVINDKFGEEKGEELLVVPFKANLDKMFNSSMNIDGFSEHKSALYNDDHGHDQTVQYSYELDLSVNQKYDQLVLGLELASRYEYTLLRCLKQTDSDLAPCVVDLIDDDSWYSHTEFIADFCRDASHSSMRHTKLTKKRIKEEILGLEPGSKVRLHASALPHEVVHKYDMEGEMEEEGFDTIHKNVYIDRGQHQTHGEFLQNFTKSLRFGSHDAGAAVGTSMARNLTLAPKLASSTVLSQRINDHGQTAVGGGNTLGQNFSNRRDRSVANTSRDDDSVISSSNASVLSYSKTRSRYTKPVVNDNSRFMQHTHTKRMYVNTQKQKNSEDNGRKTVAQNMKDFEQNMRTYQPMNKKDDSTSASSTYTSKNGKYKMEPRGTAGGGSGAIPFPIHLRSKLRNKSADAYDEEMDEEKDVDHLNEEYPSSDGDSSYSSDSSDHNDDDDFKQEGDLKLEENVNSLLADYSQLFSNGPSNEEESGFMYEHELMHESASGKEEKRLRKQQQKNAAKMDIPDELPSDLEDNDLAEAWPLMSTEEKSQSLQLLFPGKYKRTSKKSRSKKTQHIRFSEDAPEVFNTGPAQFTGPHSLHHKTTKSSQFHTKKKSRMSMFNSDMAGGSGIGGLRDSVNHADAKRNSKKKKIPFRPGGVAGLDRSLSYARKLAVRPANPDSGLSPALKKAPPRGSFWGTNPTLSRNRIERIFDQNEIRDDESVEQDSDSESLNDNPPPVNPGSNIHAKYDYIDTETDPTISRERCWNNNASGHNQAHGNKSVAKRRATGRFRDAEFIDTKEKTQTHTHTSQHAPARGRRSSGYGQNGSYSPTRDYKTDSVKNPDVKKGYNSVRKPVDFVEKAEASEAFARYGANNPSTPQQKPFANNQEKSYQDDSYENRGRSGYSEYEQSQTDERGSEYANRDTGQEPKEEGGEEVSEEDEEEDEEEEEEETKKPENIPRAKTYYDEEDLPQGSDRSKSPPPAVIKRHNKVLRQKSELEDVLHKGIYVLKYGRNGSCNSKRLYLNTDKTKLIWEEDSNKTSMSKSVWNSISGKGDESSFIEVKDIKNVYRGMQTEVFAKASSNTDPYLCLSIVCSHRSLDISFGTHPERDLVHRALHISLGDLKDIKFL